MSVITHEYPRLDDYVFGVRRGFFDSAKEELSGLERMINDGGYAWLDGYVEGIMVGSSKAPITELMKTPSRTQTTKKTRATTVAAKDRTDKVKGLNARLGLSPASAKPTSQVRQPFSPLQPRSHNTVAASPLFDAAPTKAGKAGVKGKGKALAVDKAEKPAKGKGKGKKAKTKANEENEAPTPVLAVVQDEPPFDAERLPIEPGHPATELAGKYAIEATGGSPEPPTSLPPRGQPPDVAPLAEPVLLATEPLEENVEVEDIPALHVEDESNKLRPVSLAVTAASATTDLSMIAEGEEEISASSARSTGLASQSLQQNPAVNVESQSEDLQDNQPAGDQESSAEPVTASIAVPLESVPAEYDLPPAAPTPIAATPGVPVRQVRSSWLSKALGTGTVPITGLSNGASDNSALRKSFAAPSQRGNAPVDFAALRKSLAPAGGMKRKSDEGMEEEEQETLERRPEKAVKVDFAVMPSVQPAVESISQPAPVLLASIRAPVSSTSLPAGNAPPAIPEAPLSVQNPRSDIHKVTRALDELRERAQAKELAKQRATPKATSTGSGFLRGLGNLGRSLGLGASAKTAEEEAVRLEEERKAELEAQEELERLIGEVSKPVEQVDGIRSTTPDAPLPTPLIEEARVDEVEEEAKVFEKLQEDIEVQSVQVHSPRAVRDIHSARQRTPPRTKRVILGSTTPAGTPPRVLPVAIEAPATHARPEKHVHSSPVKAPKLPTEQHIEQSIDSREAHRPVILETLLGESSVPPLEATAVEDDADTEEQEVEEGEEEEVMEVDARQQPEASTQPPFVSSSSSDSLAHSHPLVMSTSSQATSNGLLSHASTIAGKTLGFKPTTGPVKSIQLAAAAAKKEQVVNDRKAQLKDQAEQRKQQASIRKAEEDRIRLEEERKAKILEQEEKKRLRAELEKRRKERDEKMALLAKEKALKEEREAAVAKAKAEEEANKKRKFAPMLNKSGPMNPAKRIAAPASTAPVAINKPKEAPRPIKPPATLTGQHVAGPTKMGSTAFRTATTETTSIIAATSQTSTITLVNPQAERRPLGPPSRPSAMAQPLRQSSVQQPLHNPASTVLQQSRVALQSQLDEKAIEMQSEDIVLPDIASEYSDSDDSDKEDEFKRPGWAESPQLRAALEQQAHRNPDELFGPIRPISMEELFKVRQGKFRARSSSANWSGGDRLTRTEEVEYARRMGFRAVSGVGREGSGQGHTQA